MGDDKLGLENTETQTHHLTHIHRVIQIQCKLQVLTREKYLILQAIDATLNELKK